LLQQEPAIVTGHTSPQGQEGQHPVPTEEKAADVVESSKPVAVTSRTDPAHLHKLVSRRIEQSISMNQQQSTTINSTREVTNAAYIGSIQLLCPLIILGALSYAVSLRSDRPSVCFMLCVVAQSKGRR